MGLIVQVVSRRAIGPRQVRDKKRYYDAYKSTSSDLFFRQQASLDLTYAKYQKRQETNETSPRPSG